MRHFARSVRFLFIGRDLPVVLRSYLKLHSHHLKRGRAGQDGGAGLEKAGQCRPAVPEEEGVPGQEAGAEVRFTQQDRDLGAASFTLSVLLREPPPSSPPPSAPTCCSPRSALVNCSGLMSSSSTAPLMELASNNCRGKYGTNPPRFAVKSALKRTKLSKRIKKNTT